MRTIRAEAEHVLAGEFTEQLWGAGEYVPCMLLDTYGQREGDIRHLMLEGPKKTGPTSP